MCSLKNYTLSAFGGYNISKLILGNWVTFPVTTHFPLIFFLIFISFGPVSLPKLLPKYVKISLLAFRGSFHSSPNILNRVLFCRHNQNSAVF